MNVRQPPIRTQYVGCRDQIYRSLFRNEFSAEQYTERPISDSPPATQFHALRPKCGCLPRVSYVVHGVGCRNKPHFRYTKAQIQSLVGGSDVEKSIHAPEQVAQRHLFQGALPDLRRSEIITLSAQPNLDT